MERSRSTRWLASIVCGLCCALALVQSASAQQSVTLGKAILSESKGELREAVALYREALAGGETVPALLGLERMYAQLGWTDSLLPAVRAAIQRNPAEPIARTMLLRVLRTLRRETDAVLAFREWVRAVPGDIAPYREWARLLLAEGRVASVDSVLAEAQRVLGSIRGLTLEVAQLRAALGQWDHAAVAWREVIVQQDYLETAAAFSLRAAPPDARRVVRAIMLSPPVEKSPRRLLANLELGWGNGHEAWTALRELPLSDTTAAIWNVFAEDAERRGFNLPASDALMALQHWKPDAQRVLRAALNAVNGGAPESALRLAAQAVERIGPRDGPKAALPIQLRAYAALGRGATAESVYKSIEHQLAPGERTSARRDVARAWVRGGGVVQARAILGQSAPDPDDELTGWLALYEGDLAGARRGLRRADARQADAALALAFLSRTRADSARRSGAAFLTLARGDSVQAAADFAAAATELPEAAPILLLTAARLHADRKRDNDAIALWSTIVELHATSPEAAEAELEWARLLRRRGDRSGAISHLEHLILSWPGSALLPQARRELELARGGVPQETVGDV
jgi:tetratricopeptide (TPR) repeat protein